MNCIHRFVKRIIFLCDVCCILVGAVFGIQMIVQRAELKAIANERKAASEIIRTLEEENAGLISDVEAYFQEDKATAQNFRVEKEELQAIINKSGIADALKSKFTVGKEFGSLLPVGEREGIYVLVEAGGILHRIYGCVLLLYIYFGLSRREGILAVGFFIKEKQE